MSSSSSTDPETLFEVPITSVVVEKAALNASLIAACHGKHLIIFFGREQVGKSTTVNYLLGTKFDYDKNNDKNVAPLPGESFHAKMGTSDKLGEQCTVFPAAYEIPGKPDYFFFDTQGFLSQSKDSDSVAAASILLDAAVEAAASVRVVYVEDSTMFLSGNTYIADMSDLVSRVISDENVEMFCLFTKYLPTTGLSRKGFDGWPYAQKTAEVKKRLLAAATSIHESQKKTANQIEQRAVKLLSARKQSGQTDPSSSSSSLTSYASSTSSLSEVPSSSSSSDESDATIDAILEIAPEVAASLNGELNMEKALRYAKAIKANFERGHFAYVDATDESFREPILKQLFAMPTVQKGQLNFRDCTKERTTFNRSFESSILQRIAPFLRDLTYAYRFPPPFIATMINKQTEALAKHEENKKKAGRMEGLAALKDEYEVVQSELLATLVRERDDIAARISGVQDSINAIVNCKEDVLIRNYPIGAKSGGFKLWRNVTIKYDEEIPYVKVVEALEKGVVRTKTSGFPQYRFTCKNKAKGVTEYTLNDRSHPEQFYEATFSSASTGEKIALVGLKAAAFAGGILIGMLGLGPSSAAVAASAEEAATGLIQRNCSGEVHFYARKQDREADALSVIMRELEDLEEGLKTKKDRITEVESQKQAELTQKIEGAIKHCKDSQTKLGIVKCFTEAILRTWQRPLPESDSFRTLSERVLGYMTVADMLYSPSSDNNAVQMLRRLTQGLKALGAFDGNNAQLESRSVQDIPVSELLHAFDVKNVA